MRSAASVSNRPRTPGSVGTPGTVAANSSKVRAAIRGTRAETASRMAPSRSSSRAAPHTGSAASATPPSVARAWNAFSSSRAKRGDTPLGATGRR